VFKSLKIDGVWQAWNVTCDASIIVENCHRNMGFQKTLVGKEAKPLIKTLKTMSPAFSLNDSFTKVVLDSDLVKSPKGFHVFDYLQLQEAGIDINNYVRGIDFRPGSFVVFKGNIFTGIRIVDELDTYPGRTFLYRQLKGQRPDRIEPTRVFQVITPSRREVENELLDMNREFMGTEYEQCDRLALRREIKDYIDVYCYPNLDLKIAAPRCRKDRA
jgi:hypothetical protein